MPEIVSANINAACLVPDSEWVRQGFPFQRRATKSFKRTIRLDATCEGSLSACLVNIGLPVLRAGQKMATGSKNPTINLGKAVDTEQLGFVLFPLSVDSRGWCRGCLASGLHAGFTNRGPLRSVGIYAWRLQIDSGVPKCTIFQNY